MEGWFRYVSSGQVIGAHDFAFWLVLRTIANFLGNASAPRCPQKWSFWHEALEKILTN